MESNLEPYIYYIILGLALSYLYRAIKQIATKDISFFKQEIFTDESVEKWAVVDGLLKAIFSITCGVYAGLCLVGIKTFWYVPVCAVCVLILYLVLYRKILIKREDKSVNSN